MKNANAAAYTVNFAARKIVATADFMQKAGQYGSAEYNTVMSIRRDLPEFSFEVLPEKKPSKKKGCLNLDTMEAYIIRTCGESSDEIAEFRKVREESKVQKSGRYSFMKKWFHEVYPDGYKLLCELDDAEVKKQVRKDKAYKLVENAFVMRNAVSKENGGATEKSSADQEESAEENKKVVNF